LFHRLLVTGLSAPRFTVNMLGTQKKSPASVNSDPGD
jgi:hypothetical protein